MTNTTTNTARPLSTIANEIGKTWGKVNFAAKPYLSAMSRLDKVSDTVMFDTGRSVVLYFLANASTWRGADARRIKKELNDMLK
jgi:hypothetical protein